MIKVVTAECFNVVGELERSISGDSGTGSAQQILGDAEIPTLGWPPESFDAASGDEDSLMGGLGTPVSTAKATPSPANGAQSTCVADPIERRVNALFALKLLCDCPVLAPHLRELLSAK